MRNLNTHDAYRAFRDARAKMRAAGKPLDGVVLAGTLTNYAETGETYIELLRHVITANDLELLNGAKLGQEVVSVSSSLYCTARPSLDRVRPAELAGAQSTFLPKPPQPPPVPPPGPLP